MTLLRTLLVAAVLSGVPAGADAITYTALRSIGAGTLALSITTDDTIGTLAAANILDWTIGLSDANGSFTLTGPLSGGNSTMLYPGVQLSATAAGLFYDFADASFTGILFQTPYAQSGEQFYCLQSIGCYDPHGSGEGMMTTTDVTMINKSSWSGNQLIASAMIPTVPEPATWTLLIGGFAMSGLALRRRTSKLAALNLRPA